MKEKIMEILNSYAGQIDRGTTAEAIHEDNFNDVSDAIMSAMCEANACPQLYEGWRDANKELPPVEHEVYFVYDKEGSMGCAHYLGDGIFGGWPDVIAWMPLLSPPNFI